jgi:hypothetical protein
MDYYQEGVIINFQILKLKEEREGERRDKQKFFDRN